jgi:nucleotide-binding universal stress UspA family protein
MKVLIGYDGSESAQAAIRDLLYAGLPQDIHALVLSVTDVYPPLPLSSFELAGDRESLHEEPPIIQKAHVLADAAMAEALELAAEGTRRVQEVFPSWKVSNKACPGSPHSALVSESDAWKPDLVVVGSSGRSLVERLMLGNVSQNVLAYSSCSVRIGRGAHLAVNSPRAQARIVIGVDGSANAAAAVGAVANRMWPVDAEVKVITVVDLPLWTELVIAPDAPRQADDKDDLSFAQRPVESAVQELRRKGLDAMPVILEGDPKHVLLDEAKQWEAGCIFLGAKGHGRIERLLLGSVSATVAARAHCSVEVVRHASTGPEG